MPDEISEEQKLVVESNSDEILFETYSQNCPLILPATTAKVPPAKPKRKFEYIDHAYDSPPVYGSEEAVYNSPYNHICLQEPTNISCAEPNKKVDSNSHIFTQQAGGIFAYSVNKLHSSIHKSIGRSSGFLFQNLLPLKRKKREDRKVTEMSETSLDEFDITPIPAQRQQYRNRYSDGNNVDGMPTTFQLGMMSPVNEEDEEDEGDYDGSEREIREFNGRAAELGNYGSEQERFDTYSTPENIPPLTFANFNKKYSMGGVNGRRQEVAPQPQPQPISTHGSAPRHKNSSASSDVPNLKRCCCGNLLRIEVAALAIAVIELCFIVYQTFSTSLAYDKTGDENALAFTLTLFSFILAIIAVVLLLIGVHRRSPYFLVPHLLMQFAVFATAFALCMYFIFLMIGGTSVTVDTIFYEDSTRGELGLANAARIEPLRAKIVAHGLNTILISSLIATLIFFFAQVWFFVIVKKCYNIFYHLSIEKKSMIMINAATSNTTPTAVTAAKSSTSSTTTPASMTTTTDFIPSRNQQHYNNNNNFSNNNNNRFNERSAGNLR